MEWFIVVCLVFGGMLLICWHITRGLDLDRHRRQQEQPSVGVTVTSERPDSGHCILCNAPLRRSGATSDEVVFELERRIDDERLAVVRLLSQPVTENLKRLYIA